VKIHFTVSKSSSGLLCNIDLYPSRSAIAVPHNFAVYHCCFENVFRYSSSFFFLSFFTANKLSCLQPRQSRVLALRRVSPLRIRKTRGNFCLRETTRRGERSSTYIHNSPDHLTSSWSLVFYGMLLLVLTYNAQ